MFIEITDLKQSKVYARIDAITVILIPSALLGDGQTPCMVFLGQAAVPVSATEARRVRDLVVPPSVS